MKNTFTLADVLQGLILVGLVGVFGFALRSTTQIVKAARAAEDANRTNLVVIGATVVSNEVVGVKVRFLNSDRVFVFEK